MFNSKFSNILTMLLVILIVGILGLLGYFGYDIYTQYNTKNNAQLALSEFDKAVSDVKKNTIKDTNTVEEEESSEPEQNTPIGLLPTDSGSPVNSSNTSSQKADKAKTYMESFVVLGKIKIPKTGIEYPILDSVTKRSLEIAVGVQWPVNIEKLNEPGNVVILGHNYRNGLFFSNNKKLVIGDTIDITDATGATVTYVIYQMYETSPDDVSHISRDTNGAKEISLQTCTDDSSARLMILARER